MDVKTEPGAVSATTALLTENSMELQKVKQRFQTEMKYIQANCSKMSSMYNMS